VKIKLKLAFILEWIRSGLLFLSYSQDFFIVSTFHIINIVHLDLLSYMSKLFTLNCLFRCY